MYKYLVLPPPPLLSLRPLQRREHSLFLGKEHVLQDAGVFRRMLGCGSSISQRQEVT